MSEKGLAATARDWEERDDVGEASPEETRNRGKGNPDEEEGEGK